MAVNADVVYYAFGGGLGHVTRASAILRCLRRLGTDSFVVLTNSPNPLPLERESLPYTHFSDNPPETLRKEVPPLIKSLSPKVLVVDVFPGGIVSELETVLPEIKCRKILVHRHLKAGLSEDGMLRHYDAVLLAEEKLRLKSIETVTCSPILIRNADELLPRADAKKLMGIRENDLVILAVSTGSPEYTEDLFRLLAKIRSRIGSNVQLRLAWPGKEWQHDFRLDHYPLLELFNGVDVVIGAGGYNLFHETQAAGVRGIFLPQERKYDDQFWRTRKSVTANSPEDLEKALREVLASLPTERLDVRYKNGAEVAAKAIF